MWTLICLGVGWWIGRNWDFVKQQYNSKIKPKLNSAGKATKIE